MSGLPCWYASPQSSVGLAIQLACLAVTTYVLGWHGKPADVGALVIAVALATIFRFWSYRTWVWRPQPPAAAQPPAHTVLS
jgi:putative flippase GtrA